MNRGRDPFVIVQWTHAGSGVFRFQESDHQVPAGSAFIAIVPEEAEYRFQAGAPEPWRFAWINFYGGLSLQLWRALRSATGPVLALAGKSVAGRDFSQLLANVGARRFADRYEASAAGFAFFMTLCRQTNAMSSVLSRHDRTAAAARRVAGSFSAGSPAGVKLLAAEAGVTREHFSRVFRAQQGESPGKFLRLQRLQAASEMMAATSLPLREIALRCGFTSARHLTNVFQTQYGERPPRPRLSSSGDGQ